MVVGVEDRKCGVLPRPEMLDAIPSYLERKLSWNCRHGNISDQSSQKFGGVCEIQRYIGSRCCQLHLPISRSSYLHFAHLANTFHYPASTNMPGRLEGKVALVSGSTQGFGRGILETFVREGAVVLGLDLQAVDGPVDGYTEQQAYQIKANVAEELSWKKAVRTLDNIEPITTDYDNLA